MHIGCCPHVYQRLLVYLWPTYQKLTIAVWCMFSSYIAFSPVVLFYKTFMEWFYYFAHVFKVWHFVFAPPLPYQARSIRLFEFQVSAMWIHLQRCIGMRGHCYHGASPLNLAPKPQTSLFFFLWREVAGQLCGSIASFPDLTAPPSQFEGKMGISMDHRAVLFCWFAAPLSLNIRRCNCCNCDWLYRNWHITRQRVSFICLST
jgi:hypothetical protein